jgi:hypothetical protein
LLALILNPSATTHEGATVSNRLALHADESYMDGEMFVLILVTENEPGYQPLDSLWPDLAKAQAFAKERNEKMGLSEKDVLDILSSSMAAGSIHKS